MTNRISAFLPQFAEGYQSNLFPDNDPADSKGVILEFGALEEFVMGDLEDTRERLMLALNSKDGSLVTSYKSPNEWTFEMTSEEQFYFALLILEAEGR